MQLLEAFTYTDPDLIVWDAPEGYALQGMSIPRPLWNLLGAPFSGLHRRAAIVHEVACKRDGDSGVERRVADRMFYRACRASGCSGSEATLLYLGARMSAAWSAVPLWAPALQVSRGGPRLRYFASEERMESDFRLAAEIVALVGAEDDVKAIERITDDAIATVTGVDLH